LLIAFFLKSFVSDNFFSAQRGDLILALTEFCEDLVGVLAEQRRVSRRADYRTSRSDMVTHAR